MCNFYGVKVSYREYVELMEWLNRPLVDPPPQAAPNLPPLEVRPTDIAPILRPVDGGMQLAQLKWGFAPAAPKRPPVYNFRSEGRRFNERRCLIPVSYFFEFTGAKSPKTRWRFTMSGEDWFCIAGIWRPAEGQWPESYTMLTTSPGPDVAPYHDRQIVVLHRDDWATWLDTSLDPAQLLKPSPEGTLQVERG